MDQELGNSFLNFTSDVTGPPAPNHISCQVIFEEGTAIASFQPKYYSKYQLKFTPVIIRDSLMHWLPDYSRYVLNVKAQ